MPPKKDNEEGITWTNENTLMFCDVVINYITKNGRTQLIKWKDLEEMFMKTFGKRVPFKSLKNKYDSMKKDWRLWKFLKMGETGLGWNPTTGRLDCSNDWWERKLKEKPESKKFRNKGVCPQLEEKWDHLFGDAVATGVSCVAPSLNPEFVDALSDDVDHMPDLAEDTYREYTHYSRIVDLDDQEGVNNEEGLDNQEHSFMRNFAEEVTGNPPISSNIPKPSNNSVKRKRRESAGSAFMREHLNKVHDLHSDMLSMIGHNANTKKDDIGITIPQVMDIMNRMVEKGDVRVGEEVWCHALVMFRDPSNREIFFNIPNDDGRLSWLKFAHSKNIV
ncbi:hypothetical protein SSX86_027176 [Deinandra increscens subsp. villosa]|uniref:Myb/SANT-like domain-containing protein n=1 Tax=Deinandra increscens subsp. villosa TaxID=3103831 RepID=A0AAP0CJI4_9ASTR